jgi:hypothetical protein
MENNYRQYILFGHIFDRFQLETSAVDSAGSPVAGHRSPAMGPAEAEAVGGTKPIEVSGCVSLGDGALETGAAGQEARSTGVMGPVELRRLALICARDGIVGTRPTLS